MIILKDTHNMKENLAILIIYVCAKLLQSCSIVCKPIDCSPSGSSVRGILQTRILEWVTISSFKVSS